MQIDLLTLSLCTKGKPRPPLNVQGVAGKHPAEVFHYTQRSFEAFGDKSTQSLGLEKADEPSPAGDIV